MLRGIPMMWELFSLVLGLGTVAAMGRHVANPPFRVRLFHSSNGDVRVRVGRYWRLSTTDMGDFKPTDENFEDDLLAAVDKAEHRVTVLNNTRGTLLPRRKLLSQRLRS